MVLNLSDQDSSHHHHHSPNEGNNDHASVPSPPESRSLPPLSPPPRGRATLAHLARAAEALTDNDDEKDDDSPIDFSVRRQESAESYRSNDSNLDSVGESIPPSPKDMRDLLERRRNSSTSEPPLSPVSGGGDGRERTNSYSRMDEKIGEPKLGLPGMNPGMPFPPLPGQLPPGFPLHMMANTFNMLNNLPPHPRNMDPKNVLATPPNSGGGGGTNEKNGARPFKAYPKDPLSLPLGYFGLPGVPPLPGIDVASLQALNQGGGGGNNPEEMFKHYRDYVLKRMDRDRGDEKRKSPTKHHDSIETEQISPAGSPTRVSPLSPPVGHHPHTPTLSPRHPPPFPHNFPVKAAAARRLSHQSVITSNPISSDIKFPPVNMSPGSPDDEKPEIGKDGALVASSRKRGRSVDGTIIKDEAYWERRRKNNEAAKRSRDSRRAKEDEIAIRAAFLEQENLKLRVEVTALKNETAKLRCMLYNS